MYNNHITLYNNEFFMVVPERPDTEQTRRIKKNSLLPVFLVSLILSAGIAGTWFLFSSPEPSQPADNQLPTSQDTLSSPLPVPQKPPLSAVLPTDPTVHIEKEPIAREKNSLTDEPDNSTPETPSPTAFSPRQLQCRQLADKLHAFFIHLDQKEYIRNFQLGAPSQAYFFTLATKLLSTPPVVSRESDDLYSILKNMAHFFRVIGGKNIVIIKGILDRERDTIEDVAADLFQWTTDENCSDDRLSFKPPLDKLYEYAGFFLNSMGGRSYLFRRDSRSRLLINYYAILLIDRANMEGINRHGIDIKPLLPITINEIEGSNQLIYKEKYLDRLYELIEKYQ